MKLGCGGRTLEAYEYGRAKTPLDVFRRAAEEFKSPEILDQAHDEYPQEWPHIPLPPRVEASLLANAAKGMKEAQEKVEAFKQLALDMYGKESEADLTPGDRDMIAKALGEGAESIRVFKKFCLVLVKKYGYSMAEIDKIIARHLMVNGQKNRAVKAAR